MDATTADVGLQRLTFTRKPDGWVTRMFDYKPFLVFLCMLPTIGLLVVFLTYPLGLGHLAVDDRHDDRPARPVHRARQFQST